VFACKTANAKSAKVKLSAAKVKQLILELIGAAITTSVIAYKKKILDSTGAIGSGVLALIIPWFLGWVSFATIAFFVLVSYAATKYKYKQKEEMKTSQENKGIRGISNVVGNGIIALTAAIYFLPVAFAGAIAAATADTLSSELGVLSKGKPIHATRLKRVEPGTNGAVSLLGMGAGLVGALAVAAIFVGLNSISPFPKIESNAALFIAITAGGFTGNLIDTIAGATIEKRWFIDNTIVNLLCTLTGALVAQYLFLVL